MGVNIDNVRTILEPKVTPSHQSGPLMGSKTPQKDRKGDPRALTWGPKWVQGFHQGAKRTPDGALGATLGSLWEAFGGLWVTLGVILVTFWAPGGSLIHGGLGSLARAD